MPPSSGFMKYKRSYLKTIEYRSASLRETQITNFVLPTQQICPCGVSLTMAQCVLWFSNGKTVLGMRTADRGWSIRLRVGNKASSLFTKNVKLHNTRTGVRLVKCNNFDAECVRENTWKWDTDSWWWMTALHCSIIVTTVNNTTNVCLIMMFCYR